MRKTGWLILILLLVSAGCVYYNTFFNAEQYFDQAQKMELRDNDKPTANAIQNYNKTIKKCGIVLTDYKDSKYADDALYLMARCFYYIGRNYTQAIKHFEELIEFYPESEFIPDARLYIAKCNYQFRREEKALELLHEFLQDNSVKKHHPKALKILADYNLENKNFVDADFYLNKIIQEFPKSDEYEDAYFLKGKAQYEAKKYASSNEVFNALLKSKVPRLLKLDARYYIARNHLLMNEPQKALKIANALLKDEYRENNISKIQLIKARSLSGLEKNEDAIGIFDTIITDNKRTKLSAEASFFLGELYFHNLNDYEKAIEKYNNVKKEFTSSDFVNDAVTRSAVASQIIQFNNPDTNLAAEELVLQQFKLAEFYIEVLDMPDSALYVYDYIINQKNDLESRLDTLNIKIVQQQAKLDSLLNLQLAENDSLQTEIMVSDSIGIELVSIADSLKIEEKTIIDSIVVEETITDSTVVSRTVADSIFAFEETETDSTLVFEGTEADTTLAFDETELDSLSGGEENLQAKIIEQESLVNSTKLYLDRTSEDIEKYMNEFIPFARFVKLWLYRNVYEDSTRVNSEYKILEDNYAGHKYTYAAELLIQGKEVEITTKKEKQDLNDYEQAVESIFSSPDSSYTLLQNIAADSLHSYHLKAIYSLAYLNHFIYQDSTKAKEYYDTVIAMDKDNEYKPNINSFYSGNEFLSMQRLPKIISMEEQAKREAEQQAEDEKEKLIENEEQGNKEKSQEDIKRREEKEKREKELDEKQKRQNELKLKEEAEKKLKEKDLKEKQEIETEKTEEKIIGNETEELEQIEQEEILKDNSDVAEEIEEQEEKEEEIILQEESTADSLAQKKKEKQTTENKKQNKENTKKGEETNEDSKQQNDDTGNENTQQDDESEDQTVENGD